MKKKLPLICPSCTSPLVVKSLVCNQCDTEVSGQYNMPALAALPASDQQFITDFVLYSGSLKDMASKLGLSYPTVRNMLDDIIDRLQKKQDPAR